MNDWHGGKGSKPRPKKVSKKQFDDNWDRIFNNKDKADGESDRKGN